MIEKADSTKGVCECVCVYLSMKCKHHKAPCSTGLFTFFLPRAFAARSLCASCALRMMNALNSALMEPYMELGVAVRETWLPNKVAKQMQWYKRA